MPSEQWCDEYDCLVFTELSPSILSQTFTVLYEFGLRSAQVAQTNISKVYEVCEYRDHRLDFCEYDLLIEPEAGGDGKIEMYIDCKYPGQTAEVTCWQKTERSHSWACSEYHSRTMQLMHLYPAALLYVIGMLFNLLILLVLQLKAPRSVTNWLLKVLAVWDVLCLVFRLCEWAVVIGSNYAWQNQIKDSAYVWFMMSNSHKAWNDLDNTVFVGENSTYVIMYCLHTVSVIFQLCSVYQTVVIAGFRFIAIYWPFEAENYLSYKTAGVATACCLMIGLAAHLPAVQTCATLIHLIYSQGKETFYISTGSNVPNLFIPSYMINEHNFMIFFHYYHMIFYHLILFLTLPFTLLLGFNAALLYELSKNSAQHNEENKAVTKVVVAVITVFLISYTVKPLYMIDIHWLDGRMMNYFSLISCEAYFIMSATIIMLPLLNSTINFLLYIGLRKSFREQFLATMQFWKKENE